MSKTIGDNMIDRLLIATRVALWLAFLIGCGVLPVAIMLTVWHTDAMTMVQATHGLIGYAFGVLFVIGFMLGNIIVWIVTGDSVLDRLM
jgi:ATP/ADP translocase